MGKAKRLIHRMTLPRYAQWALVRDTWPCKKPTHEENGSQCLEEQT